MTHDVDLQAWAWGKQHRLLVMKALVVFFFKTDDKKYLTCDKRNLEINTHEIWRNGAFLYSEESI